MTVWVAWYTQPFAGDEINEIVGIFLSKEEAKVALSKIAERIRLKTGTQWKVDEEDNRLSIGFDGYWAAPYEAGVILCPIHGRIE